MVRSKMVKSKLLKLKVKSKKSKCIKSSTRSSNRNSKDRISNLPDNLISHILSLLTTKEAVATSVLSTKWKFLWTLITNLDFQSESGCDFYCYDGKTSKTLQRKRKKFTNYVNRVLLLLKSPFIQNFSLRVSCPCCVGSYLDSWISDGLKRTALKVTLHLDLEEGYVFPLSLMDCNAAVLEIIGEGIYVDIPAAGSICFRSLRVLHLTDISFEIESNSSFSFSNLKIMNLNYVTFENEDSAYKLFSSSPVLDDLIIKDVSYKVIGSLIINIPSLTRLSIEFNYNSDVNDVRIDCRALQFLNLKDIVPYDYLVEENICCLVQANVDIFFRKYDVNVEWCNGIIKFLQSLSNVKFLSVSGGVLKALRTASENITLDFHNLTRLEIALSKCLDLCFMINNFLEYMDNLEHLIMEGCQKWKCSCSRHTRWTEPVNVPKCLLSRLTTISFSYMNSNCCDQLKVLRYILKNAQVLQLLTISINHISEKEQHELFKKISLMPRGSRTCQVSFT